MPRAVQQRSIETRSRLLATAQQLVAEQGYAGLRIEEVVARAGVAKGTFFAHFSDKDSLMELLIAEQLEAQLARLAAQAAPGDAEQLVRRLAPLLDLMAAERCVFDLILRRSGAAAREEIGPIASWLMHFVELLANWLATGDGFRRDVDPGLLAEGVQAFVMQVLALHFCALHQQVGLRKRLGAYLRPWLNAAS